MIVMVSMISDSLALFNLYILGKISSWRTADPEVYLASCDIYGVNDHFKQYDKYMKIEFLII